MASFSYVELLGNRATWAFPLSSIVLSERTPYQLVQLVESERYGLSLFLDGHHQCATFEEWVYHELLVHPALMSLRGPKKVGVVGGGEGATLREILRYRSVQEAVQCDIDGRLVEICRDWLHWDDGAYEDSRARLCIQDGRDWLREQRDADYDVLIFDLPELGSGDISDEFYSAAWLELAASKLRKGGVFATHAGPIHMACIESFSATYQAVRAVFPNVVVYLCPEFRWSFLIASLGPEVRKRRPLEPSKLQGKLRYYTPDMHEMLGRALPAYMLEAMR